MTYAWKIKDRVIETRTKERHKESVALMCVNAKNGAVFHMSVDSLGSSAIGEWKVDDKGDAVPGMLYTGPDGRGGFLSVRYHFDDQNTITMTVELPQPIAIKIIREKPKK